MPSTPTHKNLTALIEQPESGAIESGDARQITKVYAATYSVCAANVKTKGTVGTGDLLGYVVKSSSVIRSRGDQGRLTDVWTSGGDDADPETTPLPPDEVNVAATNQAPKTERNPIFASLDSLTVGSGGTLETVLAVVDNVMRSPTAAARNVELLKITSSALTSPQKALANLLIAKLRAGNEAYYLATLRYSWATHSYSVPNSTRGGYVESISGPLASYFTGTIVWLREADDLQYSNGIWRRTRSWLGADAWDADLYP